MVKNITGASNVTEYQLVKFSQANNVYQDEILSLYIKYSLAYNIQVDVAYIMCLLYTDFFNNEIIGNNIVGIGTQKNGSKLEEFNTVEECIIAHYEILQKVSTNIVIGNPVSNLYKRIDSDSCEYSTDLYILFQYNELTNYTIYEFSRFIRELNRTRREGHTWTEGSDLYYYIRIKSDKNKSNIIRLRSDLINKKFDSRLFNITSKDGIYSLEAGRYESPINTNTLLKNLQLFGYSGEIEYSRNR